MIYNLLKNLIEARGYSEENATGKEDMINKVDVFFAFGKITLDQYKELQAMLGITPVEK